MKLDEFLEELVLEQNNWSRERFMQEKDIERLLRNKFKALIDRLNLLFENLPDTYSADAISVEGTDMFRVFNYRLPEKELKTYDLERQALMNIFFGIVLLYDKIDCDGNFDFLKKYYFKAEKLFLMIEQRRYKSDCWRRKAIVKCIEILDDKNYLFEAADNVRKLRYDMCLYSGTEGSGLEYIQSQLTDKSKVILKRNNKSKNRFESLICKYPALSKLYEKYKEALGYYAEKLSDPTLEEFVSPYGQIDTFRYIGDQYTDELTEVEYSFFKLLFRLIPLKEQGSGTKDIMGKLRKGQWEIVSKEDRDKVIQFIDNLFELDSLYRLTRYFRYKTIREIENKAEEIRFMLNDPVRYRVIKSLSEMLLLARSRTEASEEFLYEFENTLIKPYNKYKDKDEELLQLILDDEHDILDGTLGIWVERYNKLTEFIVTMKCE